MKIELEDEVFNEALDAAITAAKNWGNEILCNNSWRNHNGDP